MSHWNLRSTLILVTVIALVTSFTLKKSYTHYSFCFLIGSGILVLISMLFAYTTTCTARYRVRKLLATGFLSLIAVFCIALLFTLELDVQQFHEAGEWSPMGPEVLSFPIQCICFVVVTIATYANIHLVSIVEIAE